MILNYYHFGGAAFFLTLAPISLTSGGVMTTKKILFVASLVLIPFLVRFVRKRDEKEPQIAI
jgi:hypothetical protein